MVSRGDALTPESEQWLNYIGLVYIGIGLLMICVKDGFGGFSPGKRLLGVRAINSETGEPIGFVQSLKRNWLTLIPIMPLVMAVQLLKGNRAGDGLAGTKVIWLRHADSPVFTSEYQAGATAAGGFAAPLHAEPGPASDNPFEAPRF